MGKKGGGGNNEAAMARAEEQQRQQRIREGTARINDIFNGSFKPVGALTDGTAFDPNKTYYTSDGSAWKPTEQTMTTWDPTGFKDINNPSAGYSFGEGYEAFDPGKVEMRNGAPVTMSGATPAEQFADLVKGGKLYGGIEKAGGFTDEYFNKQRQNYIDYAMPQLEDQYAQAQKELAFSLARSGLMDSSVRASKEGELQKSFDTNKQGILDKAASYEGQARSSVEDARSNLIQMLNATGDAQGAANSAIARAAALSQQPSYSPLTQLFADFTGTLSQAAAQQRSNAFTSGGSTNGTQIYSPNRGSTVVTG